jgi:hypothetical protein
VYKQTSNDSHYKRSLKSFFWELRDTAAFPHLQTKEKPRKIKGSDFSGVSLKSALALYGFVGRNQPRLSFGWDSACSRSRGFLASILWGISLT